MSARTSVPFTHLHTHSHYSLLEALPKIDELVEAAKADGQTALALTDSGNLYGAIDFYKACTQEGIKPIIGVDLHVAPRTRHDREHRIDDKTFRIVLLAKNETGYRNLLKLVSRAHVEGFFYNARADRDLLETYKEGVIALLPAFWGEPSVYLRESAKEKAGESLAWYKKTFSDGCYQEITRHPEMGKREYDLTELILLCKEINVPLAAAHENYYLKKDDGRARELVNKIRTGAVLERDFEQGSSLDLSFITTARANELFADMPEALEHTQKIAESCTVTLKLGDWVFPHFPIPEGSTHEQELRNLAQKGITLRGLEDTPALQKRLHYELGVICSKGYSPYFLVVSDLLRHAREVGIYTNTRGSAAGSLVSYLCGITTVDPIKFNMPFERFLNPERPSPPDIDMDVADNKRDQMIEYIRGKYGDDHVAQIGTFGTMLARAAVRDVSRALGYSYAIGDRIAKLIPFPKQGFPVSIESALKDVPELAELHKTDADAREILNLSQEIEGNARHVGVHAAGVVIGPTPVSDFVPIQRDPKGGKTITQYDMYAVEEAGLLKFDVLGLKNLSVLADSVARVRSRLQTEVDLERIPLDDKKVYDMLARGETLGVFQMAGSGMTNYLMSLKPTSVEDMSAMVALYRPGPMAFIPQYIERKQNPKLVKYLDPRMEPILKATYGVLIYQDDLLMITVQLAGYSWGEADKFRKAVGKKIPEEMAKQKEPFVKGCIKNGMDPKVVQQLWEQVETFAAYGFNKAHAVSYGNLAYKTAYMKANFPVDYMAAVLTADAGDVEKIAEIVAECKRIGIAVLPPDINESRGDFTVVDEKTIRFGLYSIKNFGTGIADAIIEERDRGGTFSSISDLSSRVTSKNLNRKSLEALIRSGALDALGERGRFLASVEIILNFKREQGEKSGHVSLFGALPAAPHFVLAEAPPATLDERLAWEKELLGLYVSGHPLDKHKEKLANQKFTIQKITNGFPHGLETVIAGYIESAQLILTKNGERMGFFKVADLTGSVEVVVFPRVLKEYQSILASGSCVMLKGKMGNRKGEPSFVAEKAKAL